MVNPKADPDALFGVESRAALLAAVAGWRQPLTLPQVRRLTEMATGFGPALQPLRLAIVHTYTSDLLDPWLAMHAALAGFDLQCHHAPHGLALQEAQPGSGLLAHRPDITLLMLRREDLHPDLAAPIVGLDAKQLDALRQACLAQVQAIVGAFRSQAVGQLQLSILPSPAAPALGIYAAHGACSEAAWWAGLQSDIAAWMRSECPSSMLMDMDELARSVGRDAMFDLRFWFSAQFPFTARAASAFARQVATVGVLLKSPRAKVLVLDADNTLWGGVVGEDGIQGIALGQDYPGNAFRAFQRRILDFQQRGLILALCSKNNAADVEQVLREHPHQILREQHFSAQRVNWLDKAENLVSLAEELNVDLDSFVFVDDSDHECAAVRHALPQIEVVQAPRRAVDLPGCLDHVARLEVLALTAEDLAKTEMYAQERRRRDLVADVQRAGGGHGEYLAGLQMCMQVNVGCSAHLARLSQLTRKTNQFNLTTRRYDEQQMRALLADDDTLVLDFSLADRFGDSGIVGLAIWRLNAPASAELDSFMMSCRVIGRQAESAFLEASTRLLGERGVQALVADHFPTAKNALVARFLPEHGFERGADGRYHRSLRSRPPRSPSEFPVEVRVIAADRLDVLTNAAP